MKPCLIDTGPFVAYLNRSDPMHEGVATFINSFKGELVTTGTVIGEVMYFVSELASGPMSFAKFLIGSGARIVDSTGPQQVLAAAELRLVAPKARGDLFPRLLPIEGYFPLV